MVCYVCDSSDNWQKVTVDVGGKPVPVHSKSTIQICKECGSACHEVDPSREEKVKEYYRKEYRPAPNISNLITTTHKQNYIRVFLRDYLKSIEGKRIKMADVGCATGYLLGWFRRMGHVPFGCEYTIPYRRMAEHYYGVPVTEELDDRHRYDLIVIYHVLEHMIEPDKKLSHYASLLADGGHMLISTPEFLGDLEESAGTPMESFEHLYHKDHINLFSRQSLQNLIRKCGLSIVKEEMQQYGQTYLVRKAESRAADWMCRENWTEVERKMLRARNAIELYLSGRVKEALDVEPRFPEAWIHMILAKCAKDPGRQAELFLDAEKHLGTNCRLAAARGQWLYQQGRYAEALEAFEAVNSTRPNEDIMMVMGFCCSQVGRIPEAIRYFETAQAMDPRKWQEAQSWILKLVCSQPAWDERALAQAKEMKFKEMLEAGELKVNLERRDAESATTPA